MQKSSIRTLSRIGFLVVIFTPFTAGAWGRRGHQVVGETAAVLASGEPNSGFMRNQSFNFGYYANVPDFIWKRPATYDAEKVQHFMDMEIFERELKKHPDVKNPLELSRKEFDAQFPEIKQEAGRSFWRIRELYSRLEKTTAKLRELNEPTGEARQKLQEKWLLAAGVMGHYVGDLGMPLHVSENYDGQSTGQKGIHGYFEELMVDELYPEINCEVSKEAAKQWPAFTKKNGSKTVVELLKELGERSASKIPVLLGMDKKMKREEIKQNAKAYHAMIRQQLVDSSLVLAELYRRQLGWAFDNNRFFFFAGEPEFIPTGDVVEAAPPATKK